MSPVDNTVVVAAEAPHVHSQEPTMTSPTTTTHSTTNTPTLQTYTLTQHDTRAIYTNELPALSPNQAQFLYCNVNGIKTNCPAELEHTLTSFLQHEPTVLGLIVTKRNWKNYEATTEPL
jgi:hypothetical protein